MSDIVKNALFFHAVTPLHAGGENQVGVIDQPIQRETHTGFPKIEASGLKGCLRREFAGSEQLEELFGPDNPGNETAFASALSLSDARLLFFPVKSAKGIFAYVTCPMALKRYQQDMQRVGICVTVPECEEEFLVPAESALVVKKNGRKLLLEDYLLTEEEKNGAQQSVFSGLVQTLLSRFKSDDLLNAYLPGHAAVVSDELFSCFVQYSTEVITRVKINTETGTAEKNALFNEEYLPAESILYSLAFISKPYKENGKSADALETAWKDRINALTYLQIGANQTLGKGFVKCALAEEGGEK